MARIQYTPYAKSTGYRPQQVDERKLARMREESQRQIQGMRENAQAEINNRKEIAQQTKADQAYTKAAEEKNFQIQTKNAQNQLAGLAAEGQRIQQQYNADIKATQAIFGSLSNMSTTAAEYVKELQEEQEREKEAKERQKLGTEGLSDQEAIDRRIGELKIDESGAIINATINEYVEKGGDPLTGARAKAGSPALNYRASKVELEYFTEVEAINQFQLLEAKFRTEGKLTNTDQYLNFIESFEKYWFSQPRYVGAKAALYEKSYLKLTNFFQNKISNARQAESRLTNQNTIDKAYSLVELSSVEDLNANTQVAFNTLKDMVPTDIILDELQKRFNTRNEKGEYRFTVDEVSNVPLFYENKNITFGEKWPNRLADIKRERLRLDNQQRSQEQMADDLSFQEESDKLFEALGTDYTEDQVEEAQRTLWTKYGRVDPRFNTHAKKFTIESRLRAAEAERIVNLPDYELTAADLIALQEIASPAEYNAVKQRYDAYSGKWRSKDATDAVKRGLNVITGTTALGTSKAAPPGAAPALRYFENRAIKNAKAMETAMGGAQQALEKAVADEAKLYLSSYRDPTSVYYRKVEQDGSVSYPNLPGAGNISAADKALREVSSLRAMAKTIGVQGVLNVPNSIATAERMNEIALNYGKPGFFPTAKENAFKNMTNGMPLHEIYNSMFQAAGRPERFASPLQSVGITIPKHLQKVLNDNAASRVSKMNAVNVAMGNTGIYRTAQSMRQGSPFLVYTSGNIGPTSTGAHLDVKRTDRAKFAPNALDNYIVVEDPELGVVPLSKVPITGSFTEHTARGSHGIDYGLYEGTKIYAKNGARVISSTPTEHGDKLLIQLPDGSQYTFLHGKTAK